MKKYSRFIVYPKDVILLTGKSMRFCQRLLARTRKKFNKSKTDAVTKADVGKYLNLTNEDLEKWYLD